MTETYSEGNKFLFHELICNEFLPLRRHAQHTLALHFAGHFFVSCQKTFTISMSKIIKFFSELPIIEVVAISLLWKRLNEGITGNSATSMETN